MSQLLDMAMALKTGPEGVLNFLRINAGEDMNKAKVLREQLLAFTNSTSSRWINWGSIIIGVLLTLTIFGAIFGIPMIAFGAYTGWQKRKMLANVTGGWDAYTTEVNSQSPGVTSP